MIEQEKLKDFGRFKISYGFGETFFGEFLLATINHKVCFLGFIQGINGNDVLNQLKETFPGGKFAEDLKTVEQLMTKIFEKPQPTVDLLLVGTPFQRKVWKELTKIKSGTLVSYQDVAISLGMPRSVRAVASAIARNPISYIIPCHRVISKTGKLNNYRWGSEVKRSLIESEKC